MRYELFYFILIKQYYHNSIIMIGEKPYQRLDNLFKVTKW